MKIETFEQAQILRRDIDALTRLVNKLDGDKDMMISVGRESDTCGLIVPNKFNEAIQNLFFKLIDDFRDEFEKL